MSEPSDFLKTATGHFTAEGPIWDPIRKVFFYTDIEGGTLHKYDPSTHQTTSWQIGEKGDGDKTGQMIGGTTALNEKDGSLIIMLEHGKNAGLNYFRPENGELCMLGNVPPEELSRLTNRPNDSTVIKVGDDNLMVYGTMSKEWDKNERGGRYKPEGGFYLVDKELKSHRLTFKRADGSNFHGPAHGVAITNGLADGGTNPDGTITLFWAETVGAALNRNVYRGKLDPKTYEVRDSEVFASHLHLTDHETDHNVGRADGANMVYYKRKGDLEAKPAYAVAVLEKGEIKLFDPAAPQFTPALTSIKLPTNNVTKFAIGEDGNGKAALFVTTIDFGYRDAKKKGKDGMNGHTFLMPLPPEISLHPASVRQTSYPSMEEIKQHGVPGATPPDVKGNLVAPSIQVREPTFKKDVV